jgi:hypothetical protein
LLGNIQLQIRKSITRTNQEKVKPLLVLEVFKATRFAGAMFVGISKGKMP